MNLVDAAIHSARRRYLAVVSFEQLSIAITAVLCGAILMLLLGTEILQWYWLVLLAIIGLGLAGFRIRKRLLPRYRIAQLVDERLQLHDSLSTAWYLQSSGANESEPVKDFQLRQAGEVARSVDPAAVFPFAGQRLWALTGALAAVVFGLFALRYLVTNSLSLQHSLIPIQLAGVFEHSDNPLANKDRKQTLTQNGDRRQANSQQGNEQQQNQGATVPGEQPQLGKPNGTDGTAAGSQKVQGPQDEAKKGEPEAKDSGQGDGKTGAVSKDEAKEQSQRNSQASASKEQPDANQQNSSGLLNKMKDALSSLAAKMRPNPASQQQAENGQRSGKEQKTGDQANSSRDQNGQSQQNAQNQQGQQQNAEGQAQGQTTEKAQAAQGQTSSQSADKNSSDAHSGIGRQDGDKSLKEAQQLQAMGKLAEIIGKRSANVTGDMMVETSSGKQQLKTQYSQQVGQHSDSGGEINRDQIPVEYQQYVREYMEQVRKQGKGDK